MTYDYQAERDNLFTEDGMKTFVEVRDRVNKLIAEAGAANVERIVATLLGSSWTMLAAIDYLHETGEIIKMEFPEGDSHRWTQANVYTKDYGRP